MCQNISIGPEKAQRLILTIVTDNDLPSPAANVNNLLIRE